MRTTLNLDAALIGIARRLAAARQRSIGEVISELALEGLKRTAAPARTRNGVPLFGISRDAPPLTNEDVRRDEDE